jgi:hypothetical protein
MLFINFATIKKIKLSIMQLKRLSIALVSSILLISCGNSEPDSVAQKANIEPEKIEKSQLEEEHELFMVGYADSVNSGLREDNAFKGSARREAKGSVGGNNITVNYGSPGKRGRVIWNGLVAYDQVWVSGSHWATAVSFENPVLINNVRVEPGMYAFFTIPGREKWELILNTHFDQHLADEYDEAQNVVTLMVEPIALENEVQRLTYSVETTSDNAGLIALSWDQIRLEMPFENITE